MLHKGKPRIFDASVRASSHSRTPLTFTIGKNPHLTKKNKLHSKSTYFYRWGSRKNKLDTNLPSRLFYVIPSVCALALLVGGIIAINPVISNTAHALTGCSSNSGSSTGCDTSSTGSNATSSITLTLDPTGGAADQITDVTNVGQVTYRSNTFSVSQSSSNWYAVSVRAANGYTSDLINKQNTNARITGVGKNVSEANFKENTWGYALTTNTSADNSTLRYSTVPENSDLTPAFSETSTGKSFKVAFAAKFGPDAPSGNYQTKVYLSAVSNPAYVATGFETIEDMQEMTSDICTKAKIGDTKQLSDQRDGKMYWVAKLADSNCWMTQNLDYDGGGAKVTSISNWPSSGNTYQGYYDPDQDLPSGSHYYYNGPSNNHSQGASCSNRTGLKDCNQFSTTGTDDHYLVGNYYSWNAATNGTGGAITSDQASGSICPTGWRLPTSSGNDKEFAKLMLAYDWTTDNTSNIALTMNRGNGIYGAPLYFVYSGYLGSGQLSSAGNEGYYWSSTPSSDVSRAYYLRFSSGVYVSYDLIRYLGMPVRCVAE